MNQGGFSRKAIRVFLLFLVALSLPGCHASTVPSSFSPDQSLYYIGRGESSLRDQSWEDARHIARKRAIVSLVSIVATRVTEVRSRRLGQQEGTAADGSSSVLVSNLDGQGKVHFREERKGNRILVLAYLAKTDVPGVRRRDVSGSATKSRLSGDRSAFWVTGVGLANLSEYGIADAREIAMHRAMKKALLKGSILYQGTITAQNVQIGQVHERSLFMKDAFDILGMKIDVLPEIHQEIAGIHVRLLPVRVHLHLRAKSLTGPDLHVHLDRPYYLNGQVAHLKFRLEEPLYIAVFDRYGTSGTVVGILPTKEPLPESSIYSSTGKAFHSTSPGSFTFPPEDPRIDLVAQLPAGVTKVSEEYLVILVSKKPFPFSPRYDSGSLYYELDGKAFRELMAHMAKESLSEWSMKTIPFIVYQQNP